MLLNKQIDRQKCIGISHLKFTAFRNKISPKLEHRTSNARKYVRCARTFHLIEPLGCIFTNLQVKRYHCLSYNYIYK